MNDDGKAALALLRRIAEALERAHPKESPLPTYDELVEMFRKRADLRPNPEAERLNQEIRATLDSMTLAPKKEKP